MSALATVTENEYGTVMDVSTVRFERLLPGPIERVWSYLTDPEKRATWLAGGPMEMRPSGKVELFFRHSELTTPSDRAPEKYKKMECDGARLPGRVLRCEPPRLLSFTWSHAQGPDSEVIFELAPRDKKVVLTLTHRKLDRAGMHNVAPGWHAHLGLLEDRLAGVALRPFWATFARLESEYDKLL
jgi:uncharacterized protein YndB with AHSA1/START domain